MYNDLKYQTAVFETKIYNYCLEQRQQSCLDYRCGFFQLSSLAFSLDLQPPSFGTFQDVGGPSGASRLQVSSPRFGPSDSPSLKY